MSFQAYLDTVQEKTGKTVSDFRALADEKGLSKHGEVVAWLKGDFGLGHGHATAVAAALLKSEHFGAPKQDKVDVLFSGNKAAWRPVYDSLLRAAQAYGPDVDVAPTDSYVGLTRGGRKFAIVQPGAGRLDVGVKRKGTPPEGRFESAGTWNRMVTHRVRLTDPAQADAEVQAWLRAAYEGAN